MAYIRKKVKKRALRMKQSRAINRPARSQTPLKRAENIAGFSLL